MNHEKHGHVVRRVQNRWRPSTENREYTSNLMCDFMPDASICRSSRSSGQHSIDDVRSPHSAERTRVARNAPHFHSSLPKINRLPSLFKAEVALIVSAFSTDSMENQLDNRLLKTRWSRTPTIVQHAKLIVIALNREWPARHLGLRLLRLSGTKATLT